MKRKTPQWHTFQLGFLTALIIVVFANIQVALILTHNQAAYTTLRLTLAMIVFGIGVAALLVAIARGAQWPLPRGMQTPTSMSPTQSAWRITILGVLIMIVGMILFFQPLAH